MTENNYKNTEFDINAFLNSMVEEMGMENEDPEKLEMLKERMTKQMNQVIMDAVSMHLEDEVIDYVMENHGNSPDPFYIYTLFIKYSPNVQLGIIEALDEFRERTLKFYNTYSKQQ